MFFSCTVFIIGTYLYRENDFEDGNHFYRFLEHEPFIPKCFNFRGSVNDCEPKPAAMIGQRLTKIMSAILESYSSLDRQHVDYVGISNSEEFRRYTWYSSWFTLFHLQLQFMFWQFMEQSHFILTSDFKLGLPGRYFPFLEIWSLFLPLLPLWGILPQITYHQNREENFYLTLGEYEVKCSVKPVTSTHLVCFTWYHCPEMTKMADL